MYSTCLFCARDLGTNDVLETLPIGRRIAFDDATGRLWVVCRVCEKWNLVPFDSRLETIDRCERLFRAATLRFSTANIGIARLGEGLELVRIGKPERLEFAAWRYGDQFGRRRRVAALKLGGGALAIAGLVVLRHALVPVAGLSGAGVIFANQATDIARTMWTSQRVRAAVTQPDGTRGYLNTTQVKGAHLRAQKTGPLVLQAKMFERSKAGFVVGMHSVTIDYVGDEMVPVLGQLLPALNSFTGTRSRVTRAVELLGDRLTIKQIVESARRGSQTPDLMREPGNWLRAKRDPEYVPEMLHQVKYPLRRLPVTGRLALEMLSHEETERAALAGELRLLERQWRDADRVAKEADTLALPEDADAELARRRGET